MFRAIPPSAISLTDNRADAFLSSAANGVAVGNNSNATFEVNEPLHAGAPGGKSMWMSWLAPSNGLARFDTLGSDFDTLLAMYTTANNGVLVSLTGDDDSAGYHNSALAINAVAGQAYRIAVDGLSGSSGNVVLSWSLDPSVHIPVIAQSPTNVVVPVGGTAVFTVNATEVAEYSPLTYKWFRDQNFIEGATNATLAITNANATNLGEYTVLVKNNACQTVQSGGAFLELSSAPNTRRDYKPTALTASAVSSLAGTSLISTRRLTTEPDAGAAVCGFLSLGFGSADSFVSKSLPVLTTNNLDSARTATAPRTSSPLPISYCGQAVWMEYAFAIHADIPGVLLIRTRGAAVILSAVRWYNETPYPLDPPACAVSSNLNTEALIRMELKQDTNYVYSIVTPSGSSAPSAAITEDRIFCPHPGVAGYVITQPTNAFQPFHYGNNGVILTAQVTDPNPMCGQTLRWLKDGIPIPGEFGPSLQVTDPAGTNQYSLVVSNCAGVITNLVAALIRLEIFRDAANGPFKLKSLPLTSATFKIDAATNLAGAPPAWYPFFTNQFSHQLPVDLPSETSSNMFFRARPSP